MAISESHASHIRRVKVGFVVSSDDLVPQEITEALGITPSHSATRGDPKTNFAGKAIGKEPEGFWRFDRGFWRFDSTANVDSKDINEHFEHLLGLFLPHVAVFEGCDTFFDVLWESTYLYAGTGPLLSARVCHGIGRMGAGLGFDIYQIYEED